ncbi:hypothetical protein ACFQ9X_32490 [Catenulispora yoronensis]
MAGGQFAVNSVQSTTGEWRIGNGQPAATTAPTTTPWPGRSAS